MVSTAKMLVRVVFVVCMALILVGDYTGLVKRLLGNNKDSQADLSGSRTRARAANPGYGDNNNDIDIDADIEDDSLKNIGSYTSKSQILATIKNVCLPKLICELNATPQKDKLTESEKSLLFLIRDTSISTRAELTSKYHFAAHMGQLISGIDGSGCHNFYPTCPFPGLQILQMMKKVRMR